MSDNINMKTAYFGISKSNRASFDKEINQLKKYLAKNSIELFSNFIAGILRRITAFPLQKKIVFEKRTLNLSQNNFYWCTEFVDVRLQNKFFSP